MDATEELRRIAEDQGGDFTPLLLLGFVHSTEGSTKTVSIRSVAYEGLLRNFLARTPHGRAWLLSALDRLCDCTRPPDEQPKDAIIKHFAVGGAPGGAPLP